MIAILDTNIFISALLNPRSLPAKLIEEWIEQRFELVSGEAQIAEFRRVSRYEKIVGRISVPRAGRLVRELRANARMLDFLPAVDVCRDPNDNFLLAMAQTAKADFLVTGDKADLLFLGGHATTRIVTVRQFAAILDV